MEAPLITGAILRQICPSLHPDRAERISNHINNICPQYGINTCGILHEFLANVIVESGEFAHYEENLTYRSAKRLHEVWPYRFPDEQSGIPYLNDPRRLASKVYDRRADLGNDQPGDGFNFRGSGPIQITGRSMLTLYASYMRKNFGIAKPLTEWAELLRTSDEWGMHSACWLFAIAKDLIDEAEADQMRTIVKRINGGLTGLADRMKYYELCKKLIV